ncbi:hypothetical protein BpHYR1_009249 [Brachionus plicatilis]|uniref:HAT C-terminal dimerisation domain-containing protein n=1 Tax=Brachionus plicatilis TaxID=10195 RepID=A0A3M7T3K1_BRAPC|nr:hypothetical protein BpHYR1_009249 [Brachionus plicatilis]
MGTTSKGDLTRRDESNDMSNQSCLKADLGKSHQAKDLIRDQTELQKSTKEFYSTNSSKLPILSSVAKKLFSTPASSAFVERYFSICGVVSSKRNQNIKTKNFLCKIVLKFSFVNLSLILDSSFLLPRHLMPHLNFLSVKLFEPSVTLKFSKCSSLSVECKCNTHTHTHTQHLYMFHRKTFRILGPHSIPTFCILTFAGRSLVYPVRLTKSYFGLKH